MGKTKSYIIRRISAGKSRKRDACFGRLVLLASKSRRAKEPWLVFFIAVIPGSSQVAKIEDVWLRLDIREILFVDQVEIFWMKFEGRKPGCKAAV